MRREKYLMGLMIICISSFIIMKSLIVTAEAENISMVSKINAIKRDSIINTLKDAFINEQKLIRYIAHISNLGIDECRFIVDECKIKNIDPFIVLGVIRTESNFDPTAIGASGEIGLGQLMDNTAKPVAQNLGYEYDPNKLFDIKYNLKLTITQLSYLYQLYNRDVHKSLTAYNRGQQGLEEYIANGKSTYEELSMSHYSVKVLGFANEYKEEFVNLQK